MADFYLKYSDKRPRPGTRRRRAWREMVSRPIILSVPRAFLIRCGL